MKTSPEDFLEERYILVEDADRASYRRKSLPVLNSADEATLSTFIKYASSEPDRWHRLPESDLAFRVVPDDGEHDCFRFEIRDDHFPNEIRRYRHDRGKFILSYCTESAVEHRDLSCDNWLPRDMDQFALAVAGITVPRLPETKG